MQVLVILFLAVYQLSNRIKISPKVAAGIIVLSSYILSVTFRIIYDFRPINWYDIVMAILLFFAYMFIFHKAHQDDSIVSWIGWGVAGLVIAPLTITWLLSWFARPLMAL